MRPPKPSRGSASQAQEPTSQSKVNPALSYGKATGKTYINKGTASKNKGAGPKKKMPALGGRVISAQKKRVPPTARGAR